MYLLTSESTLMFNSLAFLYEQQFIDPMAQNFFLLLVKLLLKLRGCGSLRLHFLCHLFTQPLQLVLAHNIAVHAGDYLIHHCKIVRRHALAWRMPGWRST